MKKLHLGLAQIFLILSVLLYIRVDVHAAEVTDNVVDVKYNSHVQSYGWMETVYDGQTSGTTGQAKRIEAINISLENPEPGMRIKYQSNVQGIGWQDWVYDGQQSGTTGQALRMEAIKIVLEGAPQGYHIQYQAHVQGIGWQPWVKDGEVAGTVGQALRMEAIRIRIVKEDGTFYGKLGVKYNSHVQSIGWQENHYDGELSGTVGNNLRLEALNISIQNPIPGMKLKYQAHVQSIGWQPWVTDGNMAGTTGKALRLEAIRISLEGAPSWIYVRYKAYVEGIGWQPWVKDGETAGTTGQAKRLEALRVEIVDSRNFNYAAYNYTLNDMINTQMNNQPALQMKNSQNQYEWRYADIENGQKGYFIYTDTLDAQGNTVTQKIWTSDSNVYDTIYNTLAANINPEVIVNDNTAIYQFVKLSYIDGISADDINARFNSSGVLAGKGQVFLDAAKQYNINPAYLAAHCILETGNGTSDLAEGIIVSGVKVYNLFGIHAFDSDPIASASTYAYSQGWTDIDKAIYGGAKWISQGYINNINYKQDTIYKMKWNPENPGTHQYATDISWAIKQTPYIKECYDLFKGVKMEIEVPIYKQP